MGALKYKGPHMLSGPDSHLLLTVLTLRGQCPDAELTTSQGHCRVSPGGNLLPWTSSLPTDGTETVGRLDFLQPSMGLSGGALGGAGQLWETPGFYRRRARCKIWLEFILFWAPGRLPRDLVRAHGRSLPGPQNHPPSKLDTGGVPPLQSWVPSIAQEAVRGMNTFPPCAVLRLGPQLTASLTHSLHVAHQCATRSICAQPTSTSSELPCVRR